MKKIVAFAAVGALILSSCGAKNDNAAADGLTKSGLDPKNFVDTIDGKPVALYTLTNANGMEACVTNFGGRLVSLLVPDSAGTMRDVVLGFDNIEDYKNIPSDFGASIGRYANRINRGKFTLDGSDVQLLTNNVDNPAYAADTLNQPKYLHALHGGPTGWQYQVYDVVEANDSSIVLAIKSADGDNGFPGNLEATVTYTLTADNTLDLAYTATTDAPTVVNLTNHSYFNLNGDGSHPVTNHDLMLKASRFTPIDTTFIPLGDMAEVAATPFDFTAPKAIGADIAADHPQIAAGLGYDHNWVFDREGQGLELVGSLASPETGIVMEILTDQPGIQFYSGNFLDATVTGKYGITYPQHAGMALETQHFPDSPNHPEWPSVVLRPGEKYSTHTIYRFK